MKSQFDFPDSFDEEFVNEFNRKFTQFENDYINRNKINNDYIDSLIRLLDNNILESVYTDPVKEFHKASIKKGGFISNTNRKKAYRYIIEHLYKGDRDYNTNQRQPSFEAEEKVKDIIIKDCDRSVLNTIVLDNEIYQTVFDKESRSKYLYNLRYFVRHSLGDDLQYEYYQGYQDLALFFMMLYGKEGICLLYKFNSIFLNEYLHQRTKESATFDDYLSTLILCINHIDPNTNKMIERITQTKPYYSLSWIITWFAHKNDDFFIQFRLMDYFISSELKEIYFFSGALILSEFDKIKREFSITPGDEVDNTDLMGQVFMHYQDMKISEIDNETLISITEEVIHNKQIQSIDICKGKVTLKPKYINVNYVISIIFFFVILFFDYY